MIFQAIKKAKRIQKSMIKIESHSLKKSFTTTLKIEIEKHQTIVLMNEKNKIITTFCDKIAKYLKNLFKKKSTNSQIKLDIVFLC